MQMQMQCNAAPDRPLFFLAARFLGQTMLYCTVQCGNESGPSLWFKVLKLPDPRGGPRGQWPVSSPLQSLPVPVRHPVPVALHSRGPRRAATLSGVCYFLLPTLPFFLICSRPWQTRARNRFGPFLPRAPSLLASPRRPPYLPPGSRFILDVAGRPLTRHFLLHSLCALLALTRHDFSPSPLHLDFNNSFQPPILCPTSLPHERRRRHVHHLNACGVSTG